ncbi:MAG: hypothetical protein Q4F05_10755 [bacterium]|nr:hypothetical protein [bacterium]
MGYRYNNRYNNCSNNNNGCSNNGCCNNGCSNNNSSNSENLEAFCELVTAYNEVTEEVQEELVEAQEYLACALKTLKSIENNLSKSDCLSNQIEEWLDENYSSRSNCCQSLRCGLKEAKEEVEQLVSDAKRHTTAASCDVEKAKECNCKVDKLSNEVARRCYPRFR